MKYTLNTDVKEFNLNPATIDQVLDTSLRNGGDLAELFFEDTESTRVMYEDGKIDRIITGQDRGVGLRIIFQGRSVYGYSTDLTEKALLTLAETLSEAIQQDQSKKKKLGVRTWARTQQSSKDIAEYSIQKPPHEMPLTDKIQILKTIEGAARQELPDARQITAVWMDSLRKILILNSDGSVSKDTKTYLQLVAQVVGQKKNRVETAYESKGGFTGTEFLSQVAPESIGQTAARRVRILLDAKPAPAGTMPVVLSAEAGGTMIHEAVGHGLEADLACNGLSVYQGKLGQQVASTLISVVDDGTLPEKRGSYRFDDEGTPSKKNVLIENGILKSYLVDRLSALKFDLMTTGNGRRETFRHKPIVRMTNTYIAPGKDSPEDILKSTEWGIYVKAMGGGQVDTVTGDFVFAVTEGYLIHQGKLGDPIRGATLVGNGPRVLSIIDRVGSDLGFSTGTCGKDGQGAPVTDAQPTLRIPELTVGGEVPLTDYWNEQASVIRRQETAAFRT